MAWAMGMGLLEYQTMPSLRDVAHDGWLCTFTGQLQSGQLVRYGKGRQYTAYPSRTKSHLPGGPPCWANPLASASLSPPSFI
jgi:hypothetical protein